MMLWPTYCWLAWALTCMLPGAEGFFEFGSNVHSLKNSNDFKKWVTNSSYLVMVAFYREGCGFCQLLVEPWEKAATDLKHIVRFCGIDTEKDRKLAERAARKYGIEIKGVPTIVGFSPKSKTVLLYNGERTAAAIKSWTTSTMPNFVTQVVPKSYPSWSDYALDGTRKILLLSEKATVAPLMKAIACEFRGRVAFGLAPKRDFQHLAKSFGIEDFPALVALRRPADDFEDDAWIEKSFGSRQYSKLQLAGASKPSFRSLESWVMPFARSARSRKHGRHAPHRSDL